MKVGDWVIVEYCPCTEFSGKVLRILDLYSNPYTQFKYDALIWDPSEGNFEHCLKLHKENGYGWSAKVRPLSLLERELYEL